MIHVPTDHLQNIDEELQVAMEAFLEEGGGCLVDMDKKEVCVHHLLHTTSHMTSHMTCVVFTLGQFKHYPEMVQGGLWPEQL